MTQSRRSRPVVRKARVVAILLVCASAVGGCDRPVSVLAQLQREISNVVAGARSAVVTVDVIPASEILSDAERSEWKGAGVIIDADGTIITTWGVVEGGKSFTVMFQDGCEAPAKLLGYDRETNIALLTTPPHEHGCYPLPAAVSRGAEEVGSIALVVGNTSVSKGVAAGWGVLAESWLGGDDFYSDPLYVFQTGDALTMEGAPVVGVDGRLIGICDNRIDGHNGAWTVIPAASLLRVAREIKQRGAVRRGWLGVSCVCGSQEQPTARSGCGYVRVMQVVADSPAERAGLTSGDKIVKINGEGVGDLGKFRRVVTGLGSGAELKLEVIAESGDTRNIVATLTEFTDDSSRPCLCSSRPL